MIIVTRTFNNNPTCKRCYHETFLLKAVVETFSFHDYFAVYSRDVSGRRLYCSNPANSNTTVNVSAFAKGIYMVKTVLENGEEHIVKLVKQ